MKCIVCKYVIGGLNVFKVINEFYVVWNDNNNIFIIYIYYIFSIKYSKTHHNNN